MCTNSFSSVRICFGWSTIAQQRAHFTWQAIPIPIPWYSVDTAPKYKLWNLWIWHIYWFTIVICPYICLLCSCEQLYVNLPRNDSVQNTQIWDLSKVIFEDTFTPPQKKKSIVAACMDKGFWLMLSWFEFCKEEQISDPWSVCFISLYISASETSRYQEAELLLWIQFTGCYWSPQVQCIGCEPFQLK